MDESDRAVRLLLLQTIAEETFGGSEVAARWLRRPLGELAGAAPLDVGQTDAGARVVETVLGVPLPDGPMAAVGRGARARSPAVTVGALPWKGHVPTLSTL